MALPPPWVTLAVMFLGDARLLLIYHTADPAVTDQRQPLYMDSSDRPDWKPDKI